MGELHPDLQDDRDAEDRGSASVVDCWILYSGRSLLGGHLDGAEHLEARWWWLWSDPFIDSGHRLVSHRLRRRSVQ